MSETKFSNFTNEDGSTGPDLVGITSFTSPYYFVPPSGNTAQRPSGEGLAPGMLRFNTDIGRLEVWRADHWGTILGESPNLGISTNPPGTSGGLGTRGLSVGGGIAPSYNSNVIDYITISTLGNAIDFGDTASINGYRTSALGNSIRAVYGGAYSNTIEFVTFSSTGNATTFGSLIYSRANLSSLANSTRGIFTGGSGPTNNVIEYITISSTGNAVQFGNLTNSSSSRGLLASASSSTRGICAGGETPADTNVIDYITISTTGNAIDFGDLTKGTTGFLGGGGSNATRMLIAGGYYSGPAITAFAQFITISTLGNAQDFGTLGGGRPRGSACSSTRAVFGGGYGAETPGNSSSNSMAFYTIATTGNAIDFGDTTVINRFNHYMCSNGHGGL